MKRICLFLCFFLIVFSLTLPAFAAMEVEEVGEGESSSGSTVPVLYSQPDIYLGSDVTTYASYGSESESLKSALIQFLGEWETVVVSHNYQASDGSVYSVQEAQPDYPWLCSAGLICILVFCLFRLGGSILCKT